MVSTTSSVASPGVEPKLTFQSNPRLARQPAGLPSLSTSVTVRAVLHVEHEFAGPPAIDAEGIDPARRRVRPLAEEDTDEPDLAPRLRPDANGDFIEAFLASLLDVDIPPEGG